MRTVYVSLIATPQGDRKSTNNNPAYPEPKLLGSNTVAHLDPLCSTISQHPWSQQRAFPAKLGGGDAAIVRPSGGFTLPVCQRCSRFDHGGIDDQLWRLEALCHPRNLTPETSDIEWVQLESGSTWDRVANTNRAKAVCARCPVAEDCLDYSLAAGMEYGTWGGISTFQRRAIQSAYRREAV